MELRHMQAFIVVAEELNFRRAAERLHIAQPPLSQLVKRLEREVGTTLLRRTTRQVQLTEAGAAFLYEARRAVNAAGGATRAARLAASGETGTIRLGLSGPTFYEVLVTIARAFRTAHPNVRLEISGPRYGGELVEQLERDELDACLVRLPLAGRRVATRQLTEHRMVAVLPVSHPLAGRSRLSVADLRHEPVICYPSNRGSVTTTLIHSAFQQHGASPDIVQEAPDTHTLMLLVAIGGGVGFVPTAAAHLHVPGIKLIALDDMPPLPLAIAWLPERVSPALASLLRLLDELGEQLHTTVD